MKRKSVLLLCCIVVLSGCIQSKEHLTIHKDGSGILESTVVIPIATTQMTGMIMEGMVQVQVMQGMSQGTGQALGAKPQEAAPLPSMGDSMLGSKEKILNDAQKVGLNVEFLEFQKEKKGDGTQRYYKMKFDDINKLMQSGIAGTKFTLLKDAQGNLRISLVREPKKEQESKMQRQQFEAFKGSDKYRNMPPETQKQFMEAMANFKIEFIVTMPNEIVSVSAPFEKTDANTATMSFGGDIMKDPSLLTKLYEQSSDSATVMCSAEGVTFNPVAPAGTLSTAAEGQMEFPPPPSPATKQPSTEENIQSESSVSPAIETTPPESPLPNIPLQAVLPVPLVGLSVDTVSDESKVKVYLKNGRTTEGTLIQETDEYIKIELPEIGTIIYYRDEIERIERIHS